MFNKIFRVAIALMLEFIRFSTTVTRLQFSQQICLLERSVLILTLSGVENVPC